MSTYSDDPFASWGVPSTCPEDSDGDAAADETYADGVNHEPFDPKYEAKLV